MFEDKPFYAKKCENGRKKVNKCLALNQNENYEKKVYTCTKKAKN